MDWLAVAGIVLFVIGLMLSIALHEIGHLVPAKIFGVKVSQYMIGFGTTIWSRRRGETEYGLKAIPLGGYVRMIGMFPPHRSGEVTTVRRSSTGLFQTMVDDARKVAGEEIGPDDDERVFYRKAWWKKLVIMLGGPAVNVVIALVLAGGVLMTYGNPDKPVYAPVVGVVNECVIDVAENPDQTACEEGDPATPAAEAGFRSGDRIVSFNGVEVTSWEQVTADIRAAGDGPAVVVVERDGAEVTLRPDLIETPRPVSADPDTEYQTVGFLGVSPTLDRYEREDVGGALAWGGDFAGRTAEAMAGIPEKLGDVWQAAFGGGERGQDTPVSIVGAGRIGGEIASADQLGGTERVVTFVMLLASFNMAIALFNLVPLLPLDGGHVAGALWEGIKRAFARAFRRPEPQPVDVAKALPLAYGMAVVLVGMSALLIYADLVNPVRLFG
jgi:membrane-associated protease RseP (regulator of RpoE activity)